MLPENRTTDRQLSAATSSSIQGISNLCLLPSESFYGYRIMTPASTNPLLAGQHSCHPILLRTCHRKTKRPQERNLSSSTVAIKEKVCNRPPCPPPSHHPPPPPSPGRARAGGGYIGTVGTGIPALWPGQSNGDHLKRALHRLLHSSTNTAT